ncbi:hypothetical protein N9063_01225, partial [Deltaproteobacteria bacterium]|nr:hypothetical protein [Deltaproteobacteria bacterium]
MSDVMLTLLDTGTTGPAGAMTAWSGGTWDTSRNRLIIWGGGHNDYGDNSIWAFDIDDQTWSRVYTMGSNGHGYYSNRKTNAALNLPDNTTAANYPDGSPIARHTYQGLQYIPSIDSLVAFGNATQWRGNANGVSDGKIHFFKFSTDSWSTKTAAGISGGTADTASAYDPVTGHIFVHGNYSQMNEYDPVGDTATKEANEPAQQGVVGIDQRNRVLVVIRKNGIIYGKEIDTGFDFVQKHTTGGPSFGEGPGFVWDPVLQKLVAWMGGTSLWSLNTDTAGTSGHPWVWTEHAATDSTPTDEAGLVKTVNGIRGRFQYDAANNLYVVVTGINNNVWVRKLTASWDDNVAKVVSLSGTTTYYATIALAVAALVDGDTLIIKNGTYPGPWSLSENDITIQAETRRGVELTNSVSVSHGILRYSGDNLTVDGVVFTNAYNGHNASGIWADTGYGDLLVRNCTFT